MEEREIIAYNIAYYRKKYNLSQLELAEKLQYSNKNISKWEKGETTPSIFTLKRLAELFNITLDDLISVVGEKSQDTPQENNVSITTDAIEEEIPKKNPKLTFATKLLYLIMSNAILLLLSFIAIFILRNLEVKNFNIMLPLLYATPLSALSVFIFIACIKKRVDVVTISLFGWLTALCVYCSLINVKNIWFVFILMLAIQIILICIMLIINFSLINRVKTKINRSKENRKNKKEDKKVE